MLTIEKLKEMEPGIFMRGEIIDSPEGINMENSGKQLRWVAVRGSGYYDWTIYCYLAEKDWDFIKTQGNKVTGEVNIKKLVECDDEAFKIYRL